MFEIQIYSVGHFSNFINFSIFGDIGKRSSSSKFVYRGQPTAVDGNSLPLQPIAGRESFRKGKPKYDYLKAIRDWEKMGAGFTTGRSALEIMSSSQHFGLPTALLDWTHNPYIALWFACRHSVSELGNDADVFCLNKSQDLVRADVSQGDSSISFYDPRWIDARMRAQQAAFTFHPLLKPLVLEQLPMDESQAMCAHARCFHDRLSGVFENTDIRPHEKFNGYVDYISAGRFHNLCRIKIGHDSKCVILRELDSMGINASTVYPDAEGLVEYLQWIQEPYPLG